MQNGKAKASLPKRSFVDSIEEQVDASQPRPAQIRKLCFLEAAEYWNSVLSGDTCVTPQELPHELTYSINEETELLQKNISDDLAEIIVLGIEARKKIVEEQVGKFDLNFKMYTAENGAEGGEGEGGKEDTDEEVEEKEADDDGEYVGSDEDDDEEASE